GISCICLIPCDNKAFPPANGRGQRPGVKNISSARPVLPPATLVTLGGWHGCKRPDPGPSSGRLSGVPRPARPGSVRPPLAGQAGPLGHRPGDTSQGPPGSAPVPPPGGSRDGGLAAQDPCQHPDRRGTPVLRRGARRPPGALPGGGAGGVLL